MGSAGTSQDAVPHTSQHVLQDALPLCKRMRRLWRKFLSSASSSISSFFVLFCQFATETWMWSDCQSSLLHYKHRSIQLVVSGIIWEAPEGNDSRGCKYDRRLPQFGTRWGNATPQCQCVSCSSEFKKLCKKPLKNFAEAEEQTAEGLLLGALQNHPSHLVGNCNKTYQKVSCLENSVAVDAVRSFNSRGSRFLTLHSPS